MTSGFSGGRFFILYITMYITVYITMYITGKNVNKQGKTKKTPEALYFRGFSVEVAGFEPAAFWSRTIQLYSIFNVHSRYVHYAYITKSPGFPRGHVIKDYNLPAIFLRCRLLSSASLHNRSQIRHHSAFLQWHTSYLRHRLYRL